MEGPTDCWKIGAGAVCTFGLAWTPAQLARIASYPTRVICFDNEEEAQKQARVLCAELEPFPGRTINVCLEAKDPGSAQKEEIQCLRKEYLAA